MNDGIGLRDKIALMQAMNAHHQDDVVNDVVGVRYPDNSWRQRPVSRLRGKYSMHNPPCLIGESLQEFHLFLRKVVGFSDGCEN